jgi:hypothetical protein
MMGGGIRAATKKDKLFEKVVFEKVVDKYFEMC